MIRKDMMPDVWGDGWQPTICSANAVAVPDGTTKRLLLTDEAWIVERVGGEMEAMPLSESVEVTVGQDSELQLYRVQGMNTPAQHQSSMRIEMCQGARLCTSTITLGGQHVRNHIEVRMRGEGCEVEANGLYLIDREQQCDNSIFVEHAQPRCISRELYKGIVDDAGRARFNGHVLVQDGAVKTEAYQTNRNILLTDKAHVDTRPFLEIYNDDVKCSHGSTIGQLDEQALFYLQTRGISKRTAVTMLSYAFCDEVVRAIKVDTLRDIVGDMVKKRLHGELATSCADCAIACTTPCNGPDAHFDIDATKL